MCFSLSLSLCFLFALWQAVKKNQKKIVFICFDWLRTRRSSSLIQFLKTLGTTDGRTIPTAFLSNNPPLLISTFDSANVEISMICVIKRDFGRLVFDKGVKEGEESLARSAEAQAPLQPVAVIFYWLTWGFTLRPPDGDLEISDALNIHKSKA